MAKMYILQVGKIMICCVNNKRVEILEGESWALKGFCYMFLICISNKCVSQAIICSMNNAAERV